MGRVRSRALTFLAVFVVGGVGGALLDQIHVRAHVLRYAHPALAGQAWWVAPQFGITVGLILLVSMAVTGRASAVQGQVLFAADAAVFVLAYVVTGVLHQHPWVIVVMLLAFWVGMLRIHRDHSRLIACSVCLAVVGPIYESLLTLTGAFRYTVSPLVQRVPVWLPALYLIAGVLAASAARALNHQASAGTTPRSRPAIR